MDLDQRIAALENFTTALAAKLLYDGRVSRSDLLAIEQAHEELAQRRSGMPDAPALEGAAAIARLVLEMVKPGPASPSLQLVVTDTEINND